MSEKERKKLIHKRADIVAQICFVVLELDLWKREKKSQNSTIARWNRWQCTFWIFFWYSVHLRHPQYFFLIHAYFGCKCFRLSFGSQPTTWEHNIHFALFIWCMKTVFWFFVFSGEKSRNNKVCNMCSTSLIRDTIKWLKKHQIHSINIKNTTSFYLIWNDNFVNQLQDTINSYNLKYCWIKLLKWFFFHFFLGENWEFVTIANNHVKTSEKHRYKIHCEFLLLALVCNK